MKSQLALVTDLGGTFIKCALVKKNGKIIYSNNAPTEAKNGKDYVIKKIIKLFCRNFSTGHTMSIKIDLRIFILTSSFFLSF